MRNLFLFLVLASLTVTAACGHKKVKYDNAAAASTAGDAAKSLVAKVDFLKPKKDRIDVKLILVNGFGNPVSFKSNAIKGSFNGQAGILKRTDLSGEIGAGATEQGLVVFTFSPKIAKTGTFTLSIDDIYSGEYAADKAEASKKLAPIKLELPVQ